MHSDPVVGADFFGREEVLEILKKRVESFRHGYRQNIALIGQELLGKTSVVHQYLSQYHDNSILPVYVDIRNASLNAFADQWCQSLLFHYLQTRDEAVKNDSLERLVDRASGFIPKTVRSVRNITRLLESRKCEAAYMTLLDLPALFYRETGVRTLVILDEFQRIGDFSIKQSYQIFGKRLMVQKQTLYVIISSAPAIAREILSNKLSLLFGGFERIPIDSFSFETADDLIIKKLEPAVVTDSLRKYLIAFTDGHPFYLNVICEKMRQRSEASVNAKIGKQDLLQAFKDLLFDTHGVLNQHFMSVLSRWTQVSARGSHMALLVHIANGRAKIKELSSLIRRSAAESSRQLKELTEAEIIRRNGMFYHFSNHVMRAWIKCAYQQREMSVLIDIPSKAVRFIEECEKEMTEFDTACARSDDERIIELMEKFSNEIVEFEDKGRRLPGFKNVEIKSRQSDPDTTSVVANAGKSQWICEIVHERATEREVRRLLDQDCEKSGQTNRRVLLTLKGMEQNARLLAKNTKIWTLNLQKINALMQFYGKSKIISLGKHR